MKCSDLARIQTWSGQLNYQALWPLGYGDLTRRSCFDKPYVLSALSSINVKIFFALSRSQTRATLVMRQACIPYTKAACVAWVPLWCSLVLSGPAAAARKEGAQVTVYTAGRDDICSKKAWNITKNHKPFEIYFLFLTALSNATHARVPRLFFTRYACEKNAWEPWLSWQWVKQCAKESRSLSAVA